MKIISSFLSVAVAATLLLGGCKGKDGDPGPAGANGTNGSAGTNGANGPAGPAGPSGQNLVGTLTGFVNPVDEIGGTVAKAGVQVTLDNVTPSVSVTSDADGRFSFLNLRNGTYNLTFSRAGLVTFRRIGVLHVGGDQPTYLGVSSISQPSTLTITGITATVPANSSVVTMGLNFNSPVPTSLFRYVIFASTSPNPTAATGTAVATGSFSVNTATNSFQASATVSRFSFANAGFVSGTTLYLVAYGSTSILSTYNDPATGRLVYPALNATPSSVVSVVVP